MGSDDAAVIDLRTRRPAGHAGRGRRLHVPDWAVPTVLAHPPVQVVLDVLADLDADGTLPADDPATPVVGALLVVRAGLEGRFVAGHYRQHPVVDAVPAGWVELRAGDTWLLIDTAGPGRCEPVVRRLPCGLYVAAPDGPGGAGDRWRASLDHVRLAAVTLEALRRMPHPTTG